MFKRVLFLLLLTGFISACSEKHSDDFLPGSVVADARVSSESEEGAYGSIQSAINAAPEEGNWTIAIAPGEYYERVVVNKPNLTLVGAGTQRTRLIFDRYAGQATAPGSNEHWGTSRTAVMEITHPGVHIANLTIENSFDYLGNDALEQDDPGKMQGSQAVALKLAEYSDRTTVENVVLLGYQDTLYVKGGRSYFHGGEIRGNVDFVFGDGNAFFENVTLISRPRAKKMDTTGYITAPSTLITNAFGFTFYKCRLEREDGVPDNSVPLGRPWHPTTTFDDGRYANPFAVGTSVFIDTWMDKHIAADGWSTMSGTTKDGGRKDFSPYEDARFKEYRSEGPGAEISDKRPQINEDSINIYSRFNILDGWKPNLLNDDEA